MVATSSDKRVNPLMAKQIDCIEVGAPLTPRTLAEIPTAPPVCCWERRCHPLRAERTRIFRMDPDRTGTASLTALLRCAHRGKVQMATDNAHYEDPK
jgi:hypothetical protein